MSRVSSGAHVSQGAFTEPDWDAPVDVERTIASISTDATISGMYLLPMVVRALQEGVSLASARERYVPFTFYPLREHVRLLVEACAAVYPERPLRRALRSFGRGAPQALIASTLGKVMFGSAEGTHELVSAMTKTYAINVRGSSAAVLENGPNRCVVRLENVPYFIDSHHVGVFEGVLRHAGVGGRVLCATRSPVDADLLMEW